jgi:hypothetical protein
LRVRAGVDPPIAVPNTVAPADNHRAASTPHVCLMTVAFHAWLSSVLTGNTS